jgi:flagellar biosynthesis/type III secretory pathway protein FliH
MSTIAENLNTLYDIKEGIKEAIEGKGVTVGDASFVDYPQKINDIPQNVDCEEAYNSGYNDGNTEGYNSGYNQGKEDGYAEGNAEGQTEGYEMGYQVGNAEGLTAGKALGQDEQKAKLTTLTVDENGTYETEDGYKSVEVAVPIPTFETTELMVSIESNGQYRYEPPKDGYSLVNVGVNVDTDSFYENGFADGFSDGKTEGYNEGKEDGYELGKDFGIESTKEKMGSLTVTKNGFYSNANGYKDVTVIVPTSGTPSTDLNIIRLQTSTIAPATATLCLQRMWFSSMLEIDCSAIVNMKQCFYNSQFYEGVGPTLKNTHNVTDMSFMFENCKYMTTALSMDTSNVTKMSYMFYGCENLTTIGVMETSNVTKMDYMFAQCKALTEIPILDVSKVTDVSSMFEACYNLTTMGGLIGLNKSISFRDAPLSLESVYNIAYNVEYVEDERIWVSPYTYNLLDYDVKIILNGKGWSIMLSN